MHKRDRHQLSPYGDHYRLEMHAELLFCLFGLANLMLIKPYLQQATG
ncbi:Unknown protein sequence [Pseudomonas syringae pv. maculicola]|nr:Unknown protein sequence [Pseudomonas syringae pv. maculicola]